MRVKQVQQAQNGHMLCTCARALPVRRSTRAYTCELARDSRRHTAPSALHLVTERPALAWNFSSSCSGLAAAIMICTKTACNRYAQVAAAALVRHTGRTTSTSDQCYLACHLARVVFISSMPRERNARSPYQKSPKPKAYPRPRIRLHAPTTRQARLLYPLKSYRECLCKWSMTAAEASSLHSRLPLPPPAMLCVISLVKCGRLQTLMRWSCCA